MKQKRIWIILAFSMLLPCLGITACGETELFETVELSAPERLQITGDMLGWDKAEVAEDYGVYVDGAEYITAENSYDLSGLNQTGIYEVEVVAYAGERRSEGSKITYIGRNAPTAGAFKFMNSSKAATIMGLVGDKNGICIIPEMYNGVPVTHASYVENADFSGGATVKILYLPSRFSVSTLCREDVRGYFTNLECVYIRGGENEECIGAGNGIVDKRNNELILGGTKTVVTEGVTKIGRRAFANAGMKKFIVPEYVTEIGANAFISCSQLEEIVLPERLEKSMENPNFGSVFSGCSALKSVQIPKGFLTLKYSFQDCRSLTEIEIPDGVENLTATFKDCSSLINVVFPDSVRKLTETFRNCTALTDIAIPNGVTNMDAAFQGCTSLLKIELPNSIESIGKNTFMDCTALAEVFYRGTEAEWIMIDIKERGNEALFSATLNYYSEEAPTRAGNYWHYIDGVPTKWA